MPCCLLVLFNFILFSYLFLHLFVGLLLGFVVLFFCLFVFIPSIVEIVSVCDATFLLCFFLFFVVTLFCCWLSIIKDILLLIKIMNIIEFMWHCKLYPWHHKITANCQDEIEKSCYFPVKCNKNKKPEWERERETKTLAAIKC